jgi:glutamine amidotransferase
MIGIINYGIGNCGSIKNMLLHLGANVEIIREPDDIKYCKGIILPVVGTFGHGVNCLDVFRSELEKRVLH